jgi:hypothetical protein
MPPLSKPFSASCARPAAQPALPAGSASSPAARSPAPPLLDVAFNRCDHRSQVHKSHTAHGLVMSLAFGA